jgi:RimJ/RimL family protein N-acetyltransferase
MPEIAYQTQRGRRIIIRDLEPDDVDLLVDLFYHLSPDTIYKRFHAALHNLPEEQVREIAASLADLDPANQLALIALHNEHESGESSPHAVGVARFHRIPGTTDAESAIVIRDDYQQEGLGTFLMNCLRDRALAMGVEYLIAMVQAQNHPILKVIQRSGLKASWRFEQGETYLAVDIRPDQAAE